MFRPMVDSVLERHPAMAMAGSAAGVDKGHSSSLQTVDRVRNVFPETWLWTNTTTGYHF